MFITRHPFHFIRHGESVANRDRLIAGRSDVPLTQRGRIQAREAAAALAGFGLTGIWSSEMTRAVDTAAIIAEALDLPLKRLAGLGERDWGELEGRPLAERRCGPTGEAPGAEPWASFVDRVWKALTLVEGQAPVLLVAHSGTYRALCQGLGREVGEKLPNCRPVLITPPEG